jgi:hypothetical protein
MRGELIPGQATNDDAFLLAKLRMSTREIETWTELGGYLNEGRFYGGKE